MYKRRRTKSRSRRRVRRRTTRVTRSKRSRALTKKIKSVVLKTAETKTYRVCEVVDNTGSFYWEPLNVITPYAAGIGPSIEQFQTRFGQQYHLVGFRLNMLFNNLMTPLTTIKPMMVRIAVIEAFKEQATLEPTDDKDMFITPDSTRVAWDDIAATMASMTYKIDHKQYRVVRERTFLVGTDGNGHGAKRIDWWIPIKKNINCDEMNTGDLFQDRTYYFGFWIYDPYVPNTENPSQVVRMSWMKKTYWKDP